MCSYRLPSHTCPQSRMGNLACSVSFSFPLVFSFKCAFIKLRIMHLHGPHVNTLSFILKSRGFQRKIRSFCKSFGTPHKVFLTHGTRPSLMIMVPSLIASSVDVGWKPSQAGVSDPAQNDPVNVFVGYLLRVLESICPSRCTVSVLALSSIVYPLNSYLHFTFGMSRPYEPPGVALPD